MKSLAVVAAALWLGAASETGPLDGPLGWDGLGAVKIGMSLPLAAKLTLDRFVPGDVTAADGCREVHLRREPRAVFMVEKGTIVRVSTRDRHFATGAGVKVGDTEEQAKTRHPGLQVTPHKYDETGHYLILRSSDGASALVFETDGRKVVAIRAGRVPAAEYVEGCS